MHSGANKMNIFTWHIHGSYLYYLSQGNYNIYLPVRPEKDPGYIGKGTTFSFGDNVVEIPEKEVPNYTFDCILYQSRKNYTEDQYITLSSKQRSQAARVYLEHDPPRQHPTDTVHIVDDPTVVLVHVTQFNKLMWDSPTDNTRVITHGVTPSNVNYKGILHKGAVVINNLPQRGRRLGADIFLDIKKHIPLDLIGIDSERYGGIGEVPLSELPELLSCYRFFFNPIRYTSLGLSVCEAMILGLPVIGLATTEMVTAIDNNVSGFLDTNPMNLIEKMELLLNNKALAEKMGKSARKQAEERFNIQRFTTEWRQLFHEVSRKESILN